MQVVENAGPLDGLCKDHFGARLARAAEIRLAVARNHDDPRVAPGRREQLTDEDVARHVRQTEVAEDHVELLVGDRLGGFPSVGCCNDVRTFRTEQDREDLPDVRGILDDEYPHSGQIQRWHIPVIHPSGERSAREMPTGRLDRSCILGAPMPPDVSMIGVVDSFDDAIVITDSARVVVAWNAAMEQLTSCPRASALAACIDDVLLSLPSASWTHPIALALTGERGQAAPLAVTRPDGHRIWLEARFAPRTDAPGAVLVLRDVTESRKHALFMRALETIGRSLTSSLELDAVLDTIAEKTREVMGADAAVVASWDGRAHVLSVLRSAGRLTGEYAPGGIPLAGGPISSAVREGRAVATDDVLRDTRWTFDAERRRHIAREGFKALAAAPMMVKGVVHGALAVQHWTERTFTDDEMGLLSLLAEQAALALENARLYADARRRAERLQALSAVTRSITATLDSGDVIQRIVDAAETMRSHAIAEVHVINADASASSVAALPFERAADAGLASLVAEQRQPLLVAEPATHPRARAVEWWRQRAGASYYGVPILVGDALVGVLDYIVPDGVPDREEQDALTLLAAHAGVAIRNAALYQAEHVHAARIHALAAVNQRVSSTLDLDELLRVIAENAGQLMHVRSASFWLADDRKRTLAFTAHSDREMARDFAHPHITYEQGSLGWIAQNHQPLFIDDVFASDGTLEPDWWRANGLQSFAGFPVIADGELLAILSLCHTQPVNVSGTARDVIDMFVAQAAIAIRNARLYREAARRRDVAEALARLGRGLAATLDVERIADLVVNGMVELFGARGAAVYRYDASDETLRTIVSQGPRGMAGRPLVVRLGEGIVGRAIAERRIVVTADVLNDPGVTMSDSLRTEIERLGHRVAVGVPLLGSHGPEGALVVRFESGRVLSPEEAQALQTFADQAALALENARLYEESQRERREATALAETARTLALSLDTDEVAERIVAAVLPVFGAHHSTLYRVGDDAANVAVASAGVAREKFRRGLSWPAGTGVVGRCVQARRAMWTRDVLADPAYEIPEPLRQAVSAMSSRAVLATPLNVKSRVVGALVIGYTDAREFEPRDIALLQAFSDQAALALENAQLYASARDNLTRLREAQAQLVQAAKLGALGQLVSGVAHELNNPLSVIIGYGQLLLSRDIPATLRRPVDLMVAQGDRMAKIVRNLLYFARQRPPERTQVYLQDVVEQTLALRLNQLSLSSIEVRREYTDSLPTISADAHQLQQVFLNLLLNAEQAILSARRSGEIVIRTLRGPTGDTVVAQIEDDGPGIDAEDVSRVFEPFYTTKEVGQGTGLGLSVSYGIVEEHSGRLTVESRPGCTTFSVELPVREAPLVPAASPAPPRMLGGGRPALVVEDEPAVLDLIMTLLSESGWRVDVASGGKEALARLTERRYELVVSDVRMPEGAGDELYRKAVAQDPSLGQRFLFVTGDTANPSAWRFLDEVKVPVLEKPFRAETFLEAVRAIASLTPSGPRA
jgi:PAS domain S-box-containing protein